MSVEGCPISPDEGIWNYIHLRKVELFFFVIQTFFEYDDRTGSVVTQHQPNTKCSVRSGITNILASSALKAFETSRTKHFIPCNSINGRHTHTEHSGGVEVGAGGFSIRYCHHSFLFYFMEQ